MTIDIIGIVRFSVLSTSPRPFQIYKDVQSFEELACKILDERRLLSRFQLFETICLPSFDHQTDKRFILLVVAPRLLPEHWKDRLRALAGIKPYLRIHFADEQKFGMEHIGELVRNKYLASKGPFYTVRIDDDDAISTSFLELVRRYIALPYVNHGISFCRGFVLDIRADGYLFESQVVPNIAVGFGYVSSDIAPRTVFDTSELHHRAHQRHPVIMDATRNSWIVVSHGSNDTGDSRRLSGASESARTVAERLRSQGIAVELELYQHLQSMAALPSVENMNPLAETLRPGFEATLEEAAARQRLPTKDELKVQKIAAQVRRNRKRSLLNRIFRRSP